MDAVDAKMNGLTVPGDIRSRVFFGLLHLSLEHFGAIVVLGKKQLYASAAALLRPQYEATVRAIYFSQCASESEVVAFTEGKDPITLKKMVDSLEKERVSKDGMFINFYQNTKQYMHGFTHGGFEQLGRRYTDSELKNSFRDNEVEAIVRSGQVLACLAACCASATAGNNELAVEILEKYGAYVRQP